MCLSSGTGRLSKVFQTSPSPTTVRLRNPAAFPDQMTDLIPPACSGSTPGGLLLVVRAPEKPLKGALQDPPPPPPDQIPEPPPLVTVERQGAAALLPVPL